MDAPAAALIGAGVASVVSLSSQFLAHRLALSQDRRNARRQRFTDAITEAGAALHGPVRDERMTDEEFEKWQAALKRDSVAAQDPELTRDLLPFNEGIYRAMVTLELQFGQGHWLGKKFIDAAAVCASAEEAKSLRDHALDLMRELGLTPASRLKLGVDLIRAASAADDESAHREARERLDRRLDALDLDAGPAAPEKWDHQQRKPGDDGDDPQHGVVEDQEDDPGEDQNDPPDPLPKRRRAHGFHGESVSANPRQGQ